MNLSIIGDRVEIGGLHVATLASGLIGSPREAFIELLDAGDSADEAYEAHQKELDEQRESLEDAIGEAEDEAHEANERARAAEAEAEGYLEAIKAIAFAVGLDFEITHLELEEMFEGHGLRETIVRTMAEGRAAHL